jgi:hypothetical protein
LPVIALATAQRFGKIEAIRAPRVVPQDMRFALITAEAAHEQGIIGARLKMDLPDLTFRVRRRERRDPQCPTMQIAGLRLAGASHRSLQDPP